MFRPIAPPSRSSGMQLDSESRQKEALKMANYWLQFAENQTAMAQQAMEHAQMFFAEASQCLEGPSGDCAPKDMAVDPGLENDSEKLAPSSIKGPNGEPLAFSAKGMAAINKLMGVPSVVPSKSIAATQAPSSRPVTPKKESATDSIGEPLLYPTQLDSPIDLTRVRDSGIGIFDAPSPVNVSSTTHHQHRLPFQLRRSRDPLTYPSSNPFSLALRDHATAAENMRADLEEIQEQIDEIIEGHGRAVDTDTLRRLDFDRRGLFIPAVEEGEMEGDDEDFAEGWMDMKTEIGEIWGADQLVERQKCYQEDTLEVGTLGRAQAVLLKRGSRCVARWRRKEEVDVLYMAPQVQRTEEKNSKRHRR